MTDQTIRDLFYGNLNLFDRPMHRSDEYNTALHEAGVAREALEETMTDNQKDLLNAYVTSVVQCPAIWSILHSWSVSKLPVV